MSHLSAGSYCLSIIQVRCQGVSSLGNFSALNTIVTFQFCYVMLTVCLMLVEVILYTCTLQVVVLASLAQLLVCVELARCARSVQMQIKHVICM